MPAKSSNTTAPNREKPDFSLITIFQILYRWKLVILAISTSIPLITGLYILFTADKMVKLQYRYKTAGLDHNELTYYTEQLNYPELLHSAAPDLAPLMQIQPSEFDNLTHSYAPFIKVTPVTELIDKSGVPIPDARTQDLLLEVGVKKGVNYIAFWQALENKIIYPAFRDFIQANRILKLIHEFQTENAESPLKLQKYRSEEKKLITLLDKYRKMRQKYGGSFTFPIPSIQQTEQVFSQSLVESEQVYSIEIETFNPHHFLHIDQQIVGAESLLALYESTIENMEKKALENKYVMRHLQIMLNENIFTHEKIQKYLKTLRAESPDKKAGLQLLENFAANYLTDWEYEISPISKAPAVRSLKRGLILKVIVAGIFAFFLSIVIAISGDFILKYKNEIMA